jgi:hypothetical protein
MVAFTAGSVLTAQNLNTAFNALTLRTVTTTSDTLVLADNGGGVTYSNAAATTSTVPPNSSVAFAVGTKIVLINLGAGVVTVTAGDGVTVNGATLTLAQNAGGTCIKTATNTWSFLPFSSGVGAANFSDAATGTYTGYKYLTFTSSGTITVTTAGFADVVILAGGGAGGFSTDGNNSPGGGGAGGLYGLAVQTVYLPVGALTCTVGAGGAVNSATGSPGSSSSLGSFLAVGGSANAIRGTGYEQIGGSGGGAHNQLGTNTGFISQQGFAGGTATPYAPPYTNYGAGGGGGVGGVGGNGTTSVGGAGGAGSSTTIAGTTPSSTYVAGSYAFGGGGGGRRTDGSSGAGGSGGGGAASNGGAGTAGSANTGGGGGAGNTNAGAGGSGIVIVRVAV